MTLVYGRPQAECDAEYRGYMRAHVLYRMALARHNLLFIDIETSPEHIRQRVASSRPSRQSKEHLTWKDVLEPHSK